MTDVIQTVGAYAGLVALLALGVLSFLVFSQARDIRRLRDWAGGAPERDAEVREVSEIVAEERSAELKVLADREERRMERAGLVEPSWWERLGKSGRIIAIVAAVLIRQSVTAALGDRASCIQAMLLLRERYPDLALPITIVAPPARGVQEGASAV